MPNFKYLLQHCHGDGVVTMAEETQGNRRRSWAYLIGHVRSVGNP